MALLDMQGMEQENPSGGPLWGGSWLSLLLC